MRLEDYFDFLRPDDIRIRGHRIGIETILDEYLEAGRTPEEIQRLYPTLRLADVYATILYYLENQEAVSQYLTDWAEYCAGAEAEFDRNPPPVVARLRQVLRGLEGLAPDERIRVLGERVKQRRDREAAGMGSEGAEVT